MKRRIRHRQKQTTSLRIRIIVGASVFLAAFAVWMVVLNVGKVSDTKAFSEGDYRTAGSGDWLDAAVWEKFDGSEWIETEEPPSKSVQQITVTSGNLVTVYDEISINSLKIESGATLEILSNSIRVNKRNGNGGIECSGVLDMHDVIIEGNGDFILNEGATLKIGSDGGIDKKGNSGNVQLKGKKEFGKAATYVYNGTIRQRSGNAVPSAIENLVIDNPSGVTLDEQVTVTKELQLLSGILNSGSGELTIGQSVNNIVPVKYEGGILMGKIKYWYNFETSADSVFELTDGLETIRYTFSCNNPKYIKGQLEFNLKPGLPDDAARSPYEARFVVAGISKAGHYLLKLNYGSEDAWLQLVKAEPLNSGFGQIISWNITDYNSKAGGSLKPVSAEANFQNLLAGPSPFSDRLVLRFYSNDPGLVFVALMNSSGKVVTKNQTKADTGYNQFNFEIPQGTPAGDYTLQLSSTSEIVTMKVRCKPQINGAS